MQAQRRDDDRPLDDLSPRAARRELEPHAVALGVAEQDRLVALDRESTQRAGHRAFLRLHLLAAVVQIAEREGAALRHGDRDVERVDVKRLSHLLEDLAEDLYRVERAADGVANVHERRE